MKRGLWALPIAIPLIVLLAFGFRNNPNAVASPLLNKQAPEFRLRSLTGSPVSLKSLRGRPVVVNFWASWCESCKVEHPYLREAWKSFGSRGVAFVGVMFQDNGSAARSFLARRGGGWPDVFDPQGSTAIEYGVTQVPETFLIDRNGIVRYKSTGPITWAGPVTPAVLTRQLTHLLDSRS